jgi:hypothetical protein
MISLPSLTRILSELALAAGCRPGESGPTGLLQAAEANRKETDNQLTGVQSVALARQQT